MDIHTLRTEYGNEINNLAHKYGASNIRVFGSIARGDANNSSDIDLIVDMKTGKSLMDFVRLKLSLEDLLKHNVDLVEFSAIKPSLKKFIDKDITPL